MLSDATTSGNVVHNRCSGHGSEPGPRRVGIAQLSWKLIESSSACRCTWIHAEMHVYRWCQTSKAIESQLWLGNLQSLCNSLTTVCTSPPISRSARKFAASTNCTWTKHEVIHNINLLHDSLALATHSATISPICVTLFCPLFTQLPDV